MKPTVLRIPWGRWFFHKATNIAVLAAPCRPIVPGSRLAIVGDRRLRQELLIDHADGVTEVLWRPLKVRV